MGEKHRGVEQADKNRNGNGNNAQRRDDINTRSDNGEGTTCRTRADSETKKRLIRPTRYANGNAKFESVFSNILL